MNSILNDLLSITDKVGGLLLSKFDQTHIPHSKTTLHQTIALDQEADEHILNFLQAHYPQAGFITEEVVNRKESNFIIDALDGTTNYSHHLPFYATQIAYTTRPDLFPEIAIIHCPHLKQTFHAQKGKGAYLNRKKLELLQSINLSSSMVSIGRGTHPPDLPRWTLLTTQLIPKVKKVRLFGSSGIELAYVAAGLFNAHINLGGDLYDLAPGILLVQEAGGVVTYQHPATLSLESNNLIASDSSLINYLVKEVNHVLQTGDL